MAISYKSSFNSGELSRKMDGRSDLDIYRSGCRRLENFFVLPQGGLERRPGTEYIADTASTTPGAKSARLIPFTFSSATAYVCEFGDGYIKIWDSAGNSYTPTGTVPYAEADIRDIDFFPRFDILYLSHPDYDIQELKRTTTAPAFTISELSFDYPPFLEENDSAITINPSATTGSIGLVASAPLFDAGMIGSTFRIRHDGGGTSKQTLPLTVTATSTALDVSFSNWSVTSGGTWAGKVVLQISEDGGSTWKNFSTLADTDTGAEKNITYSSSSPARATTQIRADFTYISSTPTPTLTLVRDNSYSEGLVEVTAFTDTTNVTATVLSTLGASTATKRWTEGAFSDYRGHPNALTFFEDRMWLSGSDNEPSTLYGSVSGDYYNFITGVDSDLSIKRIPDTPEKCNWLIGKRFLFMGTEGGAIGVSSANNNELIDATNIKTDFQSVFGASDVSAILANDVVVYPQKNGLKLRELIYNWEEENFRSNDLTIMNDEILEGGIVEMFLQKQPDQVVWAIKSNGDIGTLTYERGQEVVGWSRVMTNGTIISGCAIPTSSGEDEIWLCVLRNGTYVIEKMKKRTDLDWYVDSGNDYAGAALQTADSVTVGNLASNYKITVNAVNGLSNGDKVHLHNITGTEMIDGATYTVSVSTGISFVLQDEGGTDLDYSSFIWKHADSQTNLRVDGSGDVRYDGLYTYSGVKNGFSYWTHPTFDIEIRYQFDGWYFVDNDLTIFAYKLSTDSDFPLKNGWEPDAATGPAPKIYPEKVGLSIGLDFIEVSNTISGFDHLDGVALQVVGDGSYIGEYTFQSWVTATAYAIGDIVWDGSNYYQANTAHTSSALFATDSAYWTLYNSTASAGAVFLDSYYNTITAGLGYDSIMRPMPIEPVLANRISQSRVKGAVKVMFKFFRTIGAKVGEEGKRPNIFPALNTADLTNEALGLKTGEIKFNIASDWEQEKILELKQDLPYPMTVLSMAVWCEVKGG